MRLPLRDAQVPVIANVISNEMTDAAEIKRKVNTTTLFTGSMGKNVCNI